jgi:hypothetical protein
MGWAERFPFRYPVPNDCSSANPQALKKVGQNPELLAMEQGKDAEKSRIMRPGRKTWQSSP